MKTFAVIMMLLLATLCLGQEDVSLREAANAASKFVTDNDDVVVGLALTALTTGDLMLNDDRNTTLFKGGEYDFSEEWEMRSGYTGNLQMENCSYDDALRRNFEVLVKLTNEEYAKARIRNLKELRLKNEALGLEYMDPDSSVYRAFLDGYIGYDDWEGIREGTFTFNVFVDGIYVGFVVFDIVELRFEITRHEREVDGETEVIVGDESPVNWEPVLSQIDKYELLEKKTTGLLTEFIALNTVGDVKNEGAYDHFTHSDDSIGNNENMFYAAGIGYDFGRFHMLMGAGLANQGEHRIIETPLDNSSASKMHSWNTNHEHSFYMRAQFEFGSGKLRPVFGLGYQQDHLVQHHTWFKELFDLEPKPEPETDPSDWGNHRPGRDGRDPVELDPEPESTQTYRWESGQEERRFCRHLIQGSIGLKYDSVTINFMATYDVEDKDFQQLGLGLQLGF